MESKPSSDAYLAAADRLLDARQFVWTRFPRPSPVTNLDISLIVYRHWLKGSPLIQKHIHVLLGYSAAGIRSHLRTLVGIGWCQSEESSIDRRCTVVVPKTPMVRAVEEYLQIVTGCGSD